MNIRKATEDDYILLSEMRIEMKEEAGKELTYEMQNSFYLNTLEYYKEILVKKDYVGFIAEKDGKIVGSCGIRTYRVPPTYSNLYGKHGYITNLYTRNEYRRQGIGRKLLDAAIKEAVSMECTKLTIHINEICKNMFESYGFKHSEKFMELDI